MKAADMSEFAVVLSAAKALSADERIQLIDELVVTIPAESSELPWEWEGELKRRLAEFHAGAETIPWEVVKSEARKKVGLQ